MTGMRRISILLFLVASALTIVPPDRSPAQTQPPTAPPPSGRPPRRTDGGRRGNCTVVDAFKPQVFTALVPGDGETRSLTKTPTLWFYVPYAAPAPLTLRFSLRDERGRRALFNGVPFTPILLPLSGTPGIIRLRLPQALEPEKVYQWHLTLICDTARGEGPSVNGWLRSILPDAAIQRQLSQPLTVQERLAVYRTAGIWSDRLTLLAEERERTADAGMAWTEALQEIGLADLAPVPIVPCCTLEPVSN